MIKTSPQGRFYAKKLTGDTSYGFILQQRDNPLNIYLTKAAPSACFFVPVDFSRQVVLDVGFLTNS